MDANKLEVLRALPYSVQKVCGLCRHGTFSTNASGVPINDWGTCARSTYEHKKHTGPARQLSIVRFGSCSSFELDERRAVALGAYREFLGKT